MCIGSAGCTALGLLVQQPEKLFVVDTSAAQCRLVELKRAAVQHVGDHARLLEFVDHDARPVFDDLRCNLSPEVGAFRESRRNRLRHGPNHCGQVDRNLEFAMRVFRRMVPIPFCLERRDSWRWRMAFRVGLSAPLLRLAYGPRFLKALPPDFPDLMRQQVESAFDAAPLHENPYIQQTFFGRYSSSGEPALPIYIQRQHLETVRAGVERMHVVRADIADWLEEQPSASVRFCALSNVLEVAPRRYAERLWNAVGKAMQPGRLVCTRSIFPCDVSEPVTPDGRFTYLSELSASLARLDRSPFCRFIHVHQLERS